MILNMLCAFLMGLTVETSPQVMKVWLPLFQDNLNLWSLVILLNTFKAAVLTNQLGEKTD